MEFVTGLVGRILTVVSRAEDLAEALREAAALYAAGFGTARDLRSVLYRDLSGLCADGPLTGPSSDLFNAFERWELTLHVDQEAQAAIEDEIRVIAARFG